MSNVRYKVGDKVVVLDDLSIDIHGGVHFVPGMDDYKGKVLTISSVGVICYSVKENMFNWTDEMLKPFDSKEFLVNHAEVVLKNGKKGIVAYNKIILEDSKMLYIEDYNTNLKYHLCKDLDITKVVLNGKTTYETFEDKIDWTEVRRGTMFLIKEFDVFEAEETLVKAEFIAYDPRDKEFPFVFYTEEKGLDLYAESDIVEALEYVITVSGGSIKGKL